jgi:hypothetical protein
MGIPLLPNFEIMKDGWLVQVGEGGEVILSDQDIRIPALSRFASFRCCRSQSESIRLGRLLGSVVDPDPMDP